MFNPALTLAVLALASGGAQGPPTSPPPVQEVVVVAPKDPKVVLTYPANGAASPGGTVVLKIVFDQPMTPDAWSYTASPDGAFPNCLDRPRLLSDRRTFALLCSLPPDTHFAVNINANPEFLSAAGRTAGPYRLQFTTSSDETLSLHDALALASLTDADDPILDAVAGDGAVQAYTPVKPSSRSTP